MIGLFVFIMVFYWLVLALLLYREGKNRRVALQELEKKLEDKTD